MNDRQQMTYKTGRVTHYAFCEVCGMPCWVDERVIVDCEVRVAGQTWIVHRHQTCEGVGGDEEA